MKKTLINVPEGFNVPYLTKILVIKRGLMFNSFFLVN